MHMSPTLNPRSELLPLTGLRFVAALYVFLFHVQIRMPLAGGPIGNVLSQGAAGMSLFFILSGYILSYQYAGRETPFKEYALNRLARIYPVYLAAAAVTVPWLFVQMKADGWPVGKMLGIVLTSLTGTQAWIPQYFQYWNNNASWSISAEIFFYLMFPIILPSISRVRRPWIAVAFLYLVSLLPWLLYALVGDQLKYPLPTLYAMPVFRFAEFCIGMALYRLGATWNGKYGDLIVMAGLVPLAVYLVLNDNPKIYVTSNWIVVPALAAVILGVSKGSGMFAKLLSSGPLVALGKASYCFYSLQILVFLLSAELIQRFGQPAILPYAAALLLVLTGMSFAAYHWLEEPARRVIRRSKFADLKFSIRAAA